MIDREISSSISSLFGEHKAVMLMGPRQVGKSTLTHLLLDGRNDVLWLNADDPDVVSIFANLTSTRARAFIGSNTVVVIDEAQRIPDVGLRLKLITDQIPNVQLVVTGSPSFELSSHTSESLVGRKRKFLLLPISFSEMVAHTSLIEERRLIPHRMVFGYYPEVVTSVGTEKTVLKELTDSYLYKDVLSQDGISRPAKLVAMLQALAYQIGEQVSYNEVGQLVGLDPKTVEHYVEILEKCYILFRVGSFSRNLRNELKASKKIYFYDLGIRNAIIGNFAPVETRQDVGALWENFVMAERMKRNVYRQSFARTWFWRTQQQAEIDYIEEEDGVLSAFEMKWNPRKATVKAPMAFTRAYPDAKFSVITPDNVDEFLLS